MTSETLDGPPQSDEAERGVLGGCLLSDGRAIAHVATGAKALREGHFYRQAHQRIWHVMRRLYADEEPVDAITVGEALDARGWLDSVGGRAYVMELPNLTAGNTPEALRYYADIVWDRALRRRVLESRETLTRCAMDEAMPLDEVLGRCERAVSSVTALRSGETADMGEAWESLVERLTSGSVAEPFHLDRLTETTAGGMRSGLYCLFGGMSGHGKTRFLAGLIHALLHRGKPQLFFTLEMDMAQIVAMLTAMEAGLPPDSVLTVEEAEYDPFGLFPGEERFEAIGQLAMGEWRRRLFFYDAGALDIETMDAIVRQHRLRDGVEAVHVDFVGLMDSEGREKNAQMEGLARGMAQVYKRNRVYGVVLTQTTQGKDGHQHARYGADFEHFSQCAYYIERPEPDSVAHRAGEVILKNRKNRFGKGSGHKCRVFWNESDATFQDWPAPEGER
jgi:replicative DNA helicase